MARLNVAIKHQTFTHEGGAAFAHMTPIQALRRSVLSCMLWEGEFYEDGQEIAKRILSLADQVAPDTLANLAVEARSKFHLRHAPLLLLAALARTGTGSALVSEAIAGTIQRADELSEFLAVYWKLNPAPQGKKHAPLSAQVKKGLARAFAKFDAYDLAKYNRDGAIKLRDVMFLAHPNPGERADVLKKLADQTLEAPDTWEVALSGGADKKATWERLIAERKLGYLALLRNLRNMVQANVNQDIIRSAILERRGAGRVLPFRYVAAARACPQMEPAIDQALSEAISEMAPLPGRTVVMVDVSRSMEDRLSERSDLTRMDAAAALASIIHGNIRMFTFSDAVVEVPPRRGMAGVDAIVKSQMHNGTRLFDAVAAINANVEYDRLIVVTDEQAEGAGVRFGHFIQGAINRMPAPKAKGYVINVASNKNGVGYGPWIHIDGFSEAVLRFIHEHEAQGTV